MLTKSDLAQMVLDYSFALCAISAYCNREWLYSGEKVKDKYSDKERVRKIKEYIKSKAYMVDEALHKQFTAERIGDILYTTDEIKKGYKRPKK